MGTSILKIICDKTKPDGTLRKLLDSKLINNLGWTPKVFLNKGIKVSYKDYCNKYKMLKPIEETKNAIIDNDNDGLIDEDTCTDGLVDGFLDGRPDEPGQKNGKFWKCGEGIDEPDKPTHGNCCHCGKTIFI